MPGSGKVIFIVSNNNKDLSDGAGKTTGWYLPEAAHPYEVFKNADYEITWLSPKGNLAPMDVGSGEAFGNDKICKEFLTVFTENIKTMAPKDIKPSDFDGVFYVGGHGPMFDLPENGDIAKITQTIYENGGVVGAVCHGTVGLLPVKLSSGQLLVQGQKLTSFTDAEEEAVNLTKQMPFLLETRLREKGAIFKGVNNFECNVEVGDRIVTGQNPASAEKCARQMVEVLKTCKGQKSN